MSERPILTDLYPNWMTDGEVFTMLGTRHDTPWASETDGKSLDLEYFGNRSGGKIIAPLLERMLTSTGLLEASKESIVDLIWLKFGKNWEKLWDTLNFTYNPVNNYDMTETGHIDHDANSGSNVYGFNASGPTPSGTGTDEYEDNTTLTRSGNIGVASSQSLVQEERDLWIWKYFEQIFADVDTVLALDVYGISCNGDFTSYTPTYVLPPATSDTLGGVKVGDGLSVTGDGTLSADAEELAPATSETLGGIKVGDRLTITSDGTLSADEQSAPVSSVNGQTGDVVLDIPEEYTLPAATADTLGGVKIGDGISVTEDGTISADGGGGISYSTDEQDTGLAWIDGKEIYQTTWYSTNSAGAQEWDISSLSCDTVIDIQGTARIQVSSTIYTYPLGYYESSTYQYRANVNNTRNIITTWVPGGTSISRSITIRYTKTT